MAGSHVFSGKLPIRSLGIFALAVPALLFASQSWAALGAPWQWTVDVIPNQFFDTQQEAESALIATGGKYELAAVIEAEKMTESTVTYTYGARPRGPNIGQWNDYVPGHGTTEPSAVATLEAQFPSQAGCPGSIAEPTSDWAGWLYWYSGDANQEIRRYQIKRYSTGHPQFPCAVPRTTYCAK